MRSEEAGSEATPMRVSERLRSWREGDGEKTVGGLIDEIESKSFALLFVILLGVPALPLPTGGITHVLEIVAMLLALQLIVGREEIWLPQRWRKVDLAGSSQQKFLDGLVRTVERLERFSKPRFTFLFDHRISDIVFGLIAFGGALAAFLAPPFTGLDTLPALGVVILSVAVMMEDAVIAAVGFVILLLGVAAEIFLGGAVVKGVKSIF
ncbi:MAG: exopolysaccharide biosynthesis protein [Solirubrobacterales bacterium]